MTYDLEIAWETTQKCNFSCPYCWLQDKNRSEFHTDISDIDKLSSMLDNLHLKILIHMSGGEPFLFQNYIYLCKKLTKKHIISVDTNLSTNNVYEFADTINPEKVLFIRASFQVKEWTKKRNIQNFIDRFNYLQDRKFYCFATYLMYPSVINKFEKYYHLFKSNGIVLRPKVFWGYYWGMYRLLHTIIELKTVRNSRRFSLLRRRFYYPNSYNNKQRLLIKQLIKRSEEDSHKIHQKKEKNIITYDTLQDLHWLDSRPSFKEKKCLAGVKFVKMLANGDMYRCHTLRDPYLGNIMEGTFSLMKDSFECPLAICHCPYIGYRYIVDE